MPQTGVALKARFIGNYNNPVYGIFFVEEDGRAGKPEVKYDHRIRFMNSAGELGSAVAATYYKKNIQYPVTLDKPAEFPTFDVFYITEQKGGSEPVEFSELSLSQKREFTKALRKELSGSK